MYMLIYIPVPNRNPHIAYPCCYTIFTLSHKIVYKWNSYTPDKQIWFLFPFAPIAKFIT